jgi:hypothetical protein
MLFEALATSLEPFGLYHKSVWLECFAAAFTWPLFEDVLPEWFWNIDLIEDHSPPFQGGVAAPINNGAKRPLRRRRGG